MFVVALALMLLVTAATFASANSLEVTTVPKERVFNLSVNLPAMINLDVWTVMRLVASIMFVVGFAAGYYYKQLVYERSTAPKLWITPHGLQHSHKYHTSQQCQYVGKDTPSFTHCERCKKIGKLE